MVILLQRLLYGAREYYGKQMDGVKMKKFCFMVAFFGGILIFNISHQIGKPEKGFGEASWERYEGEYFKSIVLSSVFALISFGVLYNGTSGLLTFLKNPTKNQK